MMLCEVEDAIKDIDNIIQNLENGSSRYIYLIDGDKPVIEMNPFSYIRLLESEGNDMSLYDLDELYSGLDREV